MRRGIEADVELLIATQRIDGLASTGTTRSSYVIGRESLGYTSSRIFGRFRAAIVDNPSRQGRSVGSADGPSLALDRGRLHCRLDHIARHPMRSLLTAPAVIPGGLNTLTVIVLLLTLWHASHVLGVRRTLAFFAITAVTSWLFEELGVSTGLIYGPYHYTSTLGPLLGSVPVLIPLC